MLSLSNLISRARLLTLLVLGLAACAPEPGSLGVGPATGSDGYRIYDVAAERFVSLNAIVDAAANADVLFFGEFHDDPAAHAAEVDLMRALAEVDRPMALGLEMFERDVQGAVDDYVDGEVSEESFLAVARPWPNYQTDYQPLVEIAKARGWRVLATNLPQELAASVATSGIGVLGSLPAEKRAFAAERNYCPQDEYWDRFIEALQSTDDSAAHGSSLENDPMLATIFEAQCARDEAMAETIAPLVGTHTLVLHVNGAFHTEYFLGIVPRLLRRAPTARVLLAMAVPVEDLANPPLTDDTKRADYLIYTPCTEVTDC